MSITTSVELWQSFVQSQTALDTNIICTDSVGEHTITRLYYTGRSIEQTCSRVYGVVVCPKKASHAILVVGRPDKPVDTAELGYWADKGYMTMGIDYAGDMYQGRHSIYPQSISYANYDKSGHREIGAESHQCKWYEYSVNTMRAVTYLLESGADKVSIVSYGMASRIACIVLAIDNRVTNGAILFGSLHDELPYVDSVLLDADSQKAEIEHNIAINEQLRQWELLYSPQSYVHNIHVPIYMLASGNSLVTDVLALSDSYYRTNDSSRLMVLPDTLDYCHNGILNGISQWLAGVQVPDDIELEYVNNNGVLTIIARSNLPLDKLQLWYCRNGQDNGKHWNRTTLYSTDTQGVYTADIQLYRHNSKLLSLVTYHGDIAVSSSLLTVDIDSSYELSHAVPVLYRGGTPFRFVAVSAGGDYHGISNGIEQTTGYLDIDGAKGCVLATFAVKDGSVSMSDSDTMTMDICCDTAQMFNVLLIENYGAQEQRYTATVALVGDGKWQQVVLDTSMFHSSNGQIMPSHVHADMMVFYAKELFIINNICTM